MKILDALAHGVNKISLVERPAIEEHWIALKEAEGMVLQMADAEKRMLYGAALVPDKLILRKDDAGNDYYITFSSDTIEQVAHKFMREMRLTETNHEHNQDLQQNTVVESWVSMGEKDKATALGMNVPAGTWVIGMHVGSDKYWKDYIKTGKVKGFSIEGIFADALAAEMNAERTPEDELIEELEKLFIK